MIYYSQIILQILIDSFIIFSCFMLFTSQSLHVVLIIILKFIKVFSTNLLNVQLIFIAKAGLTYDMLLVEVT